MYTANPQRGSLCSFNQFLDLRPPQRPQNKVVLGRHKMISQQAVRTPASAHERSLHSKAFLAGATCLFFLNNGERKIQAKMKNYTSRNLISHEETKKYKTLAPISLLRTSRKITHHPFKTSVSTATLKTQI